MSIPTIRMDSLPVQIELWQNPSNNLEELSVIYYPDRGYFEIAYLPSDSSNRPEVIGFIHGIMELSETLTKIKAKFDPENRFQMTRTRGWERR